MAFDIGGYTLNNLYLNNLQQNNPGIITTGLVLNLDASNLGSYSGSGTTWYDLSGTNNNGTLTNGPIYNSGANGYFAFDNVNDYVTAPSSSSYAFGTGDFTVEVWIYPTSFSGYTHLIALPDQNTFGLKAANGNGDLYFYSSSFTNYPTTGWRLTLNQWNHVVFTRSSSVAYPYLNGVGYASKSGFTNNFSAQILNIHNGFVNEFTSCRISVVRIYTLSLAAVQVTQNFEAYRGRYGI